MNGQRIGMTHAADTALTILEALRQARVEGQTPQAIVLDEATQEAFQALHIGSWAAGAAQWSLFGVPVVTGLRSGWWLRLMPEAEVKAA